MFGRDSVNASAVPSKRGGARVHAHASINIGPGCLNVGPAISAAPDTLFMRDKVFHGMRVCTHRAEGIGSATRRIKRRYFYLLMPGSLGWADSILFALLWVKWRFRFFVEDFSAGGGEGVEGDGFLEGEWFVGSEVKVHKIELMESRGKRVKGDRFQRIVRWKG